MTLIKPLKEYPQYAPILAYWTYKEWYTHRDVKFDLLLASFRKRAREDAMPYTWVAVSGGLPVGMVSLKKNDLLERIDLNPWLSSLFVESDYRNMGIAQRLIETILKESKNLGFNKIYLFLGNSDQETLDKYYRKRGWSFLDKALDNDGKETSIYYISI